MGKKKTKGDPTRSLPRNTVTLLLDDAKMFVERYKQCQSHLYYWMLCNSEFRVRYGDHLLFTTPLQGTFYYVLRYNRRYIAFVIAARSAWLIGFCTENGFFQVKSPEIDGLFMNSANTKVLPFNGNHRSISPVGTGSTIVNIHPVRRLFDVICGYRGSARCQDTPELASCFGSIVVILMEAKAWKVFLSHCKTSQGFIDEILGGWAKRTINDWSAGSQQALCSLDDAEFLPHDCGISELNYLDDLLDVFVYLHVDGYMDGMFQHDPMEPPPRKMIWDPIDKGVGDGDIMVAKEPVPRITGPSTSGVLRKRVTAERTESIEERKSKKPKGLLGGGLGGEPAAPEVFMQWIRAHNDKRRCVDLFNHLDQLGLTVLDSKRSPGSWSLRCLGDPEAISIKVNSNEKASEKPHSGSVSRASGREKLVESSTRSSKRGLHHSEIASLQDGRFVSDGIDKFVFKQYSDELRQKEIHDAVIVDVNTSLFLSRGHTTGAQKLCSNRLVIFPLNNYEESDHDRAGWSTLVLDKWTKHGPRFIHYDSWDRANLPLARHLVDVLNPFVPRGTNFCEVDAPQQVDPSDSALYTIAITRSICRWCANSSVSNEDCWSNALWTEVSTKTIERLRKSLHRGLIGHQRVDGGNVPITSTSMQPEASDGSGKKGLCPNEVASLQAGMFVPDAVINFVFHQYSEELWRNGIHDVILADANTSFLWRYGDTTGALESCSNRLVIFPVNNNVDLECAGGGTHWSLLVLDKWTELGPRFIHYDSYGASNSAFARRYAVVLQPFVPASTYFIEADTPQQENLFDCGIYIIAIARSICQWCMGASLSDEEDWSQTLRREVNAETTANLRTLLHLELQEHLQKPNKPM